MSMHTETAIAGRCYRLSQTGALDELQLTADVCALFSPLLSDLASIGKDKFKMAAASITLLSNPSAPRVIQALAESTEIKVRGRWVRVDINAHFTGRIPELLQVAIWAFTKRFAMQGFPPADDYSVGEAVAEAHNHRQQGGMLS